MDRVSVTSSNLNSVGYDSQKEILKIEFHSGGIYQYFDVTSKIYDELMTAPSHGKYFARVIKPRFKWTQIR